MILIEFFGTLAVDFYEIKIFVNARIVVINSIRIACSTRHPLDVGLHVRRRHIVHIPASSSSRLSMLA